MRDIGVILCLISAAHAAILEGPIHTARNVGSDIILNCEVKFDVTDDVFLWLEYVSDRSEGQPIYSSETDQVTDPTKYEVKRSGNGPVTRFRLTLKFVKPEMAGFYGCALNKENVTANASVVVAEKVKCEARPADLVEGDKTVLFGESSYTGVINAKTFMIGGYWDNLPTEPGKVFNETTNVLIGRTTFHDTLITDRRDHMRPYRGVFQLIPQPERWELAFEDVCTLRLSIKHAPKIIGIKVNNKEITDTNSSIPVRVEYTVVCSHTAHPEPEFLWHSPDVSFNSHTFIVQEQMAGEFSMTCTITNELGQASQKFAFHNQLSSSSSKLKHVYLHAMLATSIMVNAYL